MPLGLGSELGVHPEHGHSRFASHSRCAGQPGHLPWDRAAAHGGKSPSMGHIPGNEWGLSIHVGALRDLSEQDG